MDVCIHISRNIGSGKQKKKKKNIEQQRSGQGTYIAFDPFHYHSRKIGMYNNGGLEWQLSELVFYWLLQGLHFKREFLKSSVVNTMQAMHLIVAWCCSLSQCISRGILGGVGVAPAVAMSCCCWGVAEVLMLYCFGMHLAFPALAMCFGGILGLWDAAATPIHFLGGGYFGIFGASAFGHAFQPAALKFLRNVLP